MWKVWFDDHEYQIVVGSRLENLSLQRPQNVADYSALLTVVDIPSRESEAMAVGLFRVSLVRGREIGKTV